MKKILLLSAMAAVFLFGCKKEHSTPGSTAQKKYPVTFNMTDFTQTISSVSGKQQVNSLKTDAATANIAAYTKVLYLIIYNSSGNMVRRLEQASTVSNYGVIADSLAAGTYTIVVAAGQSALKSNAGAPNGGKPSSTTLGDGVLYYLDPTATNVGVATRYAEGTWSDTFFDKFQLTVTSGPVNQTVNLTRIVSKLEVDFNDIIPSNAASVDLFLSKESFQYALGSASPVITDTITTHFAVPDSVKGTSNYRFSQLVLNTTAPFSVTLVAHDASHNILATHVISSVTCQANKRTILSGNFSNQAPNNNNGFSVSLDPNWGTQNTVHY